jgi:uncharacterized membrane protein YvbJ
MPSKSSFSCPACGETVPAKAKACPHCGACEKSGWNEEASEADGLDLPEEDFDYEKFTAEEFGTPRKLRRKELLLKIVACVLVVLLFIMFVVSNLFR